MPRYTDKQIEDALKATKGMVYIASRNLGCSINTIKARLAKSATLRAVIDAESGMVTDTAELKLFSAILNGEPWAIQFYLRTKGRKRGYGEHIDISGIRFDLLSNEQLQRIAAGEDPIVVLATPCRSADNAEQSAATEFVN